MKKRLATLAFISILGLEGCGNYTQPSDKFRLQIVHINDTHSHIEPIPLTLKIDNNITGLYVGGYAKLAKYIKDIKKRDSHAIALHAGDAVQGTLYYILFKGKADVDALNQMELDAMTLGNHEFDDGANILATDFVLRAKFPIISCDVDMQNNPKLKGKVKPYLIKNIDGQKIAIIGDTVDSSASSQPGPTIQFLNYLTTAKKYVKELKTKGINKIIFLTHIGYDTDKYLATQIEDIDVIVGGHSHTLIGNFSNLGLESKGPYPTIVEHNNSRTLVLTAWKWGEVVGDINVTFDNKGVITSYTANPVILTGDKFFRKNNAGKMVEVDNNVKKEIEKQISKIKNLKIEQDDKSVDVIIDKYKKQVDKYMQLKIGEATQTLTNNRLPNDDGSDGSMVAPYVALSIYEKVNKTYGCDFVLQNAGGVRKEIKQGPITLGEVYNILPFNNSIIIIKMKGKDILKMMKNLVKISLIEKKETGVYPYFAGAKMTLDIDNDIISSFKIKNNSQWIEIEPDKEYSFATNSFIARGKGYYEEISKKAISKYDTGFIDTDIFIDYIKTHKILKPLPNN